MLFIAIRDGCDFIIFQHALLVGILLICTERLFLFVLLILSLFLLSFLITLGHEVYQLKLKTIAGLASVYDNRQAD